MNLVHNGIIFLILHIFISLFIYVTPPVLITEWNKIQLLRTGLQVYIRDLTERKLKY